MFNFLKKNSVQEEQICALEARICKLENRIAVLEAQICKIKKEAGEPKKKTKKKTEVTAVSTDNAEPEKKLKEDSALVSTDAQKKKSKKAAAKERAAQKKEKYLKQVIEITGWDRETALKKMERAQEVAGSSFEHYAIYRFWELDEETQKTYFTKRDAVILRRKYNTDKALVNALMNKDLCCTKFEEFLGRPWMRTIDMTLESFKEKFADQKKIIYKPISSSGGHGIQVMELNECALETLYENLKALPAGIIEGYLIQHPLMQQLSVNSVNTIRIVTLRAKNMPNLEKDKVYFLYSGIRMGQGTSYVDNLHSGGLMAAVDVETGNVVTGGVDHKVQMFDVHPGTGAQIKGFTIPFYQEAKQMIENASKTKDVYGLLGWDVAITENGPVLIEINTSPGADGLQTPYVPQQKGMRYVIEKYL